jgi:hypothetical protein
MTPLNTRRSYYLAGEWSKRFCSPIGHNLDCVRVEWTGTLGSQRIGTATCLNCGSTCRAIEYARNAR